MGRKRRAIRFHRGPHRHSAAVQGSAAAIGRFAGVSISGLITADIASRHADRVRRATLIEAPFRDKAWHAANWQGFQEMHAARFQPFEKLTPRFRALTQAHFRRLLLL